MFDEVHSESSSDAPAGAVIFDLNASSLSAVADKVADELLNKDEIRASDYESLKRALVMRRR